MIFSLFLVATAFVLVIAARHRWRLFSALVALEFVSSTGLGMAGISGVWFPLAHSVLALVFMAAFLQLQNGYAPRYVQSMGIVVAIDLLAFAEYWIGLDLFYPMRPYLLAPVAVYQLWLSYKGGRDGGVRAGSNFPGHIGRGNHRMAPRGGS